MTPETPPSNSLPSKALSSARSLVNAAFDEGYTKPVASYRRLPITDRIKIVAVATLVIGTGLLYWAEVGHPEANIKGLADAAWCTIVTMFTVGYGDRYAVTDLGRIVSLFIIAGGCSTLAMAIGYYAGQLADKDKAVDGEVNTIEELRDELRRRDEEHTKVLRLMQERIEGLSPPAPRESGWKS